METSATLRLRGRHAPVVTELHWPAGPNAGLVIVLGLDAVAAREMARRRRSVVALLDEDLCTADAWAAVQWLADHVVDLGIAAGPVRVAGLRNGAGTAVALTERAASAGWPDLTLQRRCC